MPPTPISFSYSKPNLTNITQQSTIYVPSSDPKQGTNIFVAEVIVKGGNYWMLHGNMVNYWVQ